MGDGKWRTGAQVHAEKKTWLTQAVSQRTQTGGHTGRQTYTSVPTQAHEAQLCFYLLAGADGRGHGTLCAASLHLDRLWGFKHGRRLEVTAGQKDTESTLSEQVLVKCSTPPFLKEDCGLSPLWREQPIACHICSYCTAVAFFQWINQTAVGKNFIFLICFFFIYVYWYRGKYAA